MGRMVRVSGLLCAQRASVLVAARAAGDCVPSLCEVQTTPFIWNDI